MDSCKVCQDADCTSDTLDIIKDACSDNTVLSTQMSIPLSTSTDVNEYINTINSDYSFQLAEFTLFKFPNNSEGKLCLLKSSSSISVFSYHLMQYFAHSKTVSWPIQTKGYFTKSWKFNRFEIRKNSSKTLKVRYTANVMFHNDPMLDLKENDAKRNFRNSKGFRLE